MKSFFNTPLNYVIIASHLLLVASCGTVPKTPASTQHGVSKEMAVQLFSQLSQQPLPASWQAKPAQSLNVLDCAELQSGKTISLTGDNQIPASCDLWQKNTHFVIQNSDTSLDCQGVAMSVNGSTTQKNITAFAIQTPISLSKTGQGQGIGNIRLDNCIAVGYGHGVLVEQAMPANQRYEQLLQQQTTRDAQQQLSPNHILLNRILVADSKNSGVFIGDHVQDVTLTNSRVLNAGTVGVYFEFGSGHNTVQDSSFSQNGIRQINVGGVGVGKPNREAIAIDSSQHNKIRHNQFEGNGGGGVFLYRNCFEHANDKRLANHFLRVDGSNGNLIESNTFVNEPVGVWVASRQSRNLRGFECGAYVIRANLLESYHLDEAEQNTIAQNTFDNVEQGIVIEDDNNVVRSNTFLPTVNKPITIGSMVRETSSEGVVKGNQINQNTFGDMARTLEFVGKSEPQNLHCANVDNKGKIVDSVCLIN